MHQKSKKQRFTKRKIETLLLAILLAFSMVIPSAARVSAYDGTETDTTGWIQPWTHFGSGGNVEWAIDPDGTLWLRPENGASSGTMGVLGSSGSAARTPWNSLKNSVVNIDITDNTTVKAPADSSHLFASLGTTGNGYADLTGFDTSAVENMHAMLSVTKVKSIKLDDSFDTSQVTTMRFLFYATPASTIDMGEAFTNANVTMMNSMFDATPNLARIYLPEGLTQWTNDAYLSSDAIAGCTTNWIREDETYGPFTAQQLYQQFPSNAAAMAGWWVREKTPGDYTVSFAATDNTYSGSLAQMTGEATDALALPKNTFAKNNYRFLHWDDGQGNTYADEETIPAHRYTAGSNITLTAVFEYDRSTVEIKDNEFEITLKANEKMTLPELPAGTAYQIYEETPDGWVLIEQTNASGKIEPLQTSEASFKNRYQPGTTTAQFSGTKTLDMRAAAADAFSFSLYEGDTFIQTVKTLDGGFFQFDVIEYDDTMLGRHTYTIKENDPEDDTLDWDRHTETVIVDVVDNGDGTLSSTITYDEDGIVFSNMTRPGILEVKKNAEGLTDANGDETYTFKITLNNENGMPLSEGDTIYWYKKDADGEIIKSNNLLGRLAAFFSGDETRAAKQQESAIENSN